MERIVADDLENLFVQRLPILRVQNTGMSAQEFSIQLGVNKSYINKIENHLTLPSMRLFFAMCEMMQVHPVDYFNTKDPAPNEIKEIVEDLYSLGPQERQHVWDTIKYLKRDQGD